MKPLESMPSLTDKSRGSNVGLLLLWCMKLEVMGYLDGCIDIQAVSYSVQKYFPIIMYCEVCCCLHINCLQIFKHMSTPCGIKVYVFVKFTNGKDILISSE